MTGSTSDSSDTPTDENYPKPVFNKSTNFKNRRSKCRKVYMALVIISLLIIGSCGLEYLLSPIVPDVIGIINDPTGAQQVTFLFNRKEFTKEIAGYNFTIIAKAKYTLTGKVVAIDEYDLEFDSLKDQAEFMDETTGSMNPPNVWDLLLPMDFTIVWGKIIDPYYYKYFEFGHGYRCSEAKWRYEPGNDLSKNYIIKHHSNNHLLFANESIHNDAKKVEVGDIVVIEGHLVYVYANRISDGAELGEWRSSINRYDPGYRACETIYVEKITVLDIKDLNLYHKDQSV